MTRSYPNDQYVELNFSQAGAVQNIWYTALEGANIEVVHFSVGVTVADETLEMKVTLDGTEILTAAGVACTFAADPYSALPVTVVCTTGQAVFTQGAKNAAVTTTDTGLKWCRGANVKIEVRKTTAGGASAVTGKGIYFKR